VWVKQVTALSIAATAFLGCTSNPEEPKIRVGDMREFVAAVSIDSCYSFPQGWPSELEALCGKSCVISVSFDFVYQDVTREVTIWGGAIKRTRTFRTGPGTWEFSNPEFRDALLHHLDGRPLDIRATRTVGPDSDVREISVSELTGHPDLSYRFYLHGLYEMPVDTAGFPAIENTIRLSGFTGIWQRDAQQGYYRATGDANAEIKNLRELPIEKKRVPPVVPRPILTPQELISAPSTLEFGDKRLVFIGSGAIKSWGNGPAVQIGFSIQEESYCDVDELRLDFLWVVHETGVWEPEIVPVWDTYYFRGVAYDGPTWPTDTDVAIVVGFVDLNGDVSLMRITETIDQGF